MQKTLGPCRFLGSRASPRALVAKRVHVRIREKEGFTHPPLASTVLLGYL
jgi:hypothetical protein